VAIPGATLDNPSGLTDWNVRRGWGLRTYNWEFSAGVQHEVLPRVSVDVAFFRRWFGNFTATDNLAVGPSDFRSFDITTPVDSRLPGGGGQTIVGFNDLASVAAQTATAVNRSVFADDLNANQIDHWNGVDINVNARLRNGLLLQGGTSTGRRSTNNCGVVAALPETLGNNPTSFCDQVEPFRTQVKGVAAYTLPRYGSLPSALATIVENIQLAGTFQSIPGDAMTATYSMPQVEFQSALSTLSTQPACTGQVAVGLCNANTKTVALFSPVERYDERQNQLDLRVGRILRFGRTRTSLNLDVFNVTNANTVLSRNNSFSKTPGYNATTGVGINNSVNTLWAPTSLLQARFYKLSATFDF
jgi:hypothetical protein